MITLTTCIHCWAAGVEPTNCPVLRSCAISPAVLAAQQTTPATPSTARIADSPRTPSANRTPEVSSSAQIVIPDTGEFEDPTRPTIYVATATKRNDALTITMVAAIAVSCESSKYSYNPKTPATHSTSSVRIAVNDMSRSTRAT